MFLNFLRKFFIVESIKKGERPDLEVKAIEIALKSGIHEFKEGESYQYDEEDWKKRTQIDWQTLLKYSKEHNMHYIPGTNPENGFDTVELYPKRAV